MKKAEIAWLIIAFLFLTGSILGQVPKPEEVIGFKVGTARKVADMYQIIDYFHRIGQGMIKSVTQDDVQYCQQNDYRDCQICNPSDDITTFI